MLWLESLAEDTHTHTLWSRDSSSSSNTSQPQPQPRPPQLTSPVIGHHQEVLLLDAEGLPVHRRVRLQRLVLHEAPPPPLPAVDDRQLRLRLPGVGHRQKHLKKNSKSPVKLSLSSWTCSPAVSLVNTIPTLAGGQSESFLLLELLELSPPRQW